MDAFDEMLHQIKEYGYTDDEIKLLDEFEDQDLEEIVILFYRFLKISQETNNLLGETCRLLQEDNISLQVMLVNYNLQSVMVFDRANRGDLLDD